MAAEPLLQRAPAGDGHHVLVLPGFLADDCSTLGLRWHLRNLGYTTHGWDLGRNVGPTREIVAGMRQCLDSLADEYGEKISLVGWSLGGIYAREMAREVPEEVRQVITLASPFRLTNLAQTRTGRLYQYYRPRHEPRYQVPPYAASHRPLAVPSTAITTERLLMRSARRMAPQVHAWSAQIRESLSRSFACRPPTPGRGSQDQV